MPTRPIRPEVRVRDLYNRNALEVTVKYGSHGMCKVIDRSLLEHGMGAFDREVKKLEEQVMAYVGDSGTDGYSNRYTTNTMWRDDEVRVDPSPPPEPEPTFHRINQPAHLIKEPLDDLRLEMAEWLKDK